MFLLFSLLAISFYDLNMSGLLINCILFSTIKLYFIEIIIMWPRMVLSMYVHTLIEYMIRLPKFCI